MPSFEWVRILTVSALMCNEIIWANVNNFNVGRGLSCGPQNGFHTCSCVCAMTWGEDRNDCVITQWHGFGEAFSGLVLWDVCVWACVSADGAIWQLVHAGAPTPKSTIHTQLQITQHSEPYRQHRK